MSLANLIPIAERNAIDNVVCALEWDPSQQIKNVEKIQEHVSSQLKDFTSQDVVSMTMRMPLGPANPVMQPTAQEKSGFILKNESSGQVITFADAKILFQFNQYTRWEELQGQLKEYFDVFFQAFGDNFPPLTTWGQQVTDIFLWRDDPEKLNLAEVFHPSCDLFPPSLINKRGLWHSHYGFTENYEDDVKGIYIENINLSRFEKKGTHTIQLTQAHRFNAEKPLHAGTQVTSHQILKSNNDFHEKNKSNMQRIFSKEVLSKLENFYN